MKPTLWGGGCFRRITNWFPTRARISLSVFVFVAFTGSCKTWVPTNAKEPILPATQEGPIRVTRADKTTVTLTHVEVTADSLIGFAQEDPSRRVAIPLSDVKKVEKRELSRAVVLTRYYFYFVAIVGMGAMAWVLR